MSTDYARFVASKLAREVPTGLPEVPPLPTGLYPHQRDLVAWALRRGRCAIFAQTGLGKSRCEIAWGHALHRARGIDVLLLAPLGVVEQTAREEAPALGVPVTVCHDGADVQPGLNLTNYERLHRFAPSRFGAVILDESSAIKHADSKTFAALTEAFAPTPFKLCATATPAPNDWVELGTHAEFLGVCTRAEMLAEWFVHDGGDTSSWRLKGHAREAFWRWVASWGAVVRHPRDLGYDTAGYDLPPLEVRRHVVQTDHADAHTSGLLFPLPARTLADQRAAKRASLSKRVAHVVELVRAEPAEPWVVWAELNAEQDALADALGDACVSIAGRDEPAAKVAKHAKWLAGEAKVLLSKPSIFGFGMNWQHCARMAFVGVTHSFEAFYQAVRRCHRFGQRRPVVVHVVCGDMETEVLASLDRKARDFEAMGDALGDYVAEAARTEVRGVTRETNVYAPAATIRIPAWLKTEVA
jgi:hypothetical protein